MTNISIHPATHELLKRFYGEAPTKSLRGYVVVEDAKVVIVVGVYVEKSRLILFSEVSPNIDRTEFKYKRQAVLLKRKLHHLMIRYNLPIHSMADPDIPGSDRLLKHLGFQHITEGVYEWAQQ